MSTESGPSKSGWGMHPSENFKMGSTSNIFLAYPI